MNIINADFMINPILSIITVNYNNDFGLKKTIESIRKQSFSSYEHIIIDAASNDGSKTTIEQYEKETQKLSYWVSEPDKGIYDGMNKGIKKAQGEYFLFLNSGDCLLNEILQRINFNGVQYIYGDAIITTNKKTITRKYPDKIDFIYLSNNSFNHQSCFIHKSLFINHLYDCNYKIISDWAHCFESIVKHRCSYRHIPLFISVCDGNGISSNYSMLQKERHIWFKENYPPLLSDAYIDCSKLDESELRSIISLIYNTRKFKKRVKKIIFFLYKLNSLFSK